MQECQENPASQRGIPVYQTNKLLGDQIFENITHFLYPLTKHVRS